ncbi:squalene/phytoene synthase family protein [Thioalkalivibrio sp. HK1]|uniref:squalene/phytoene synthase family protein n=1 Tax=Thioalkalivibrio sp. HK1 TaxID=1469245 RepID=UPI000471DDE1|nr:squalene/phytoene synthase family protein [Thioalkalivibrio sp. HK1]
MNRADLAWQDKNLQEVSRTFALVIPQLPQPVCEVVGNAYLLCRIADIIEDEPDLSFERKRDFSERFIRVIEGHESGRRFADDLHPLLVSALPGERALVCDSERAVRIASGFNDIQRNAIHRCVGTMARGMVEFQRTATLDGLDDLSHLGRYCYHVAGVVGEMLTEIFCDHSPAIAARRDRLISLSVSFGQGLQMTNILKDLWDDRRRGACWLPKDIFRAAGFDLRSMRSLDEGVIPSADAKAGIDPSRTDPAFARGLQQLVVIACGHLEKALRFTLLIPKTEIGIRRFCLWALGMAVLTLRKIHSRLMRFSSARDVKISRLAVYTTVAITSVSARSDRVLEMLFDGLTRPLDALETAKAKPASG